MPVSKRKRSPQKTVGKSKNKKNTKRGSKKKKAGTITNLSNDIKNYFYNSALTFQKILIFKAVIQAYWPTDSVIKSKKFNNFIKNLKYIVDNYTNEIKSDIKLTNAEFKKEMNYIIKVNGPFIYAYYNSPFNGPNNAIKKEYLQALESNSVINIKNFFKNNIENVDNKAVNISEILQSEGGVPWKQLMTFGAATATFVLGGFKTVFHINRAQTTAQIGKDLVGQITGIEMYNIPDPADITPKFIKPSNSSKHGQLVTFFDKDNNPYSVSEVVNISEDKMKGIQVRTNPHGIRDLVAESYPDFSDFILEEGPMVVNIPRGPSLFPQCGPKMPKLEDLKLLNFEEQSAKTFYDYILEIWSIINNKGSYMEYFDKYIKMIFDRLEQIGILEKIMDNRIAQHELVGDTIHTNILTLMNDITQQITRNQKFVVGRTQNRVNMLKYKYDTPDMGAVMNTVYTMALGYYDHESISQDTIGLYEEMLKVSREIVGSTVEVADKSLRSDANLIKIQFINKLDKHFSAFKMNFTRKKLKIEGDVKTLQNTAGQFQRHLVQAISSFALAAGASLTMAYTCKSIREGQPGARQNIYDEDVNHLVYNRGAGARKTIKKKKGRSVKGSPSLTRKGDMDYTTKRGDRDYHHKKHNIKKKNRPFSVKKGKSKSKGKRSMRRRPRRRRS
jgi:hypothetical protein